MPACSCNTCMSGCTCINNGNNTMAIMQWVLLPALATHSTRLVCVAHTAVRSDAMLPYLLSVRAAVVVVARVPGRPGIVESQPRMDCISTCRMNELLRQPPRRMNALLRRQPPHGQHECGVALDVALDGQTYHRVQRCYLLHLDGTDYASAASM